MIYFVTGRPEVYDWKTLNDEDISYGSFDEFVHWSQHTDDFGFDTETTMTKDGPNAHQDRQLLVIQLGGEEDQWVIDFVDLPDYWLTTLRNLLSDRTKRFYIHNSKFDYIVIKVALGISIENMHDTYLMSRILNTGIDTYPGYHSLAGCLKRFFEIEISKDAQTTFTGEPLSLNQIEYSAVDVIMMQSLFDKLKEELDKWELWYLYDVVERHVVKAYADMELNPMNFDRDYWLKLAEEFEEEDIEIEKELNAFVFKDPLLVNYLKNSDSIINIPLIQPVDELFIKWGSPVHKRLVLGLLAPSLPLDVKTKPQLKKFLKANEEILPEREADFLKFYMERKYDKLTDYLVTNHHNWLIDNGLLIEEGTTRINWASSTHKLLIFQFYYPRLTSTNASNLAKIKKNDLIVKYKQYSAVHKTVTTYGRKFLDNYVKRDGTISPSGLSQILNTGRVAFGILLQMPGKAKFRNGFLPPKPDWVFVDSDYASAEVCIMAAAAGETSFLDAVKEGKDLHSMSASLIFADKWTDIAEPDCQQLIDGSRCKCQAHDKLRSFSKTITFGLAYGLTHMGLADRLEITKTEALDLMAKFFKAFPRLEQFFDASEKSGQDKLYVRGLLPTGRIRFFEHPEHDQDNQAIGRAAKNFPIQECNASMLKIALVDLRERIIANNYPAMIHLPVHDEILSSCHKDFAEEWVTIQEDAMKKAADQFIEPGMLGADTDILERWTK